MLDVLIVGGGPAGAVAATVLARAGVDVRIVDRAAFPRDKLCGDTVNPGALGILGRLGLARTIPPVNTDGHCCGDTSTGCCFRTPSRRARSSNLE